MFNGSSGELAAYDGTNFARNSDVVFVTPNMRLNYLGFLDVSAYGDERFKNSGNLGLTDMVLSLKWVRNNIAAFGGDPGNVTIVGQSGGCGKVTSLACLPAADGLFDKVVMISGPYLTFTKEHQLGEAAKLVKYLGLTDDDDVIGILKAMSYDELFAACKGAGVFEVAQIDGDYFPSAWFDPATGKMNEYAAKRTYMISSTFSELKTNGRRFVLDERYNSPIDMSYYRPNMTNEWKEQVIADTFGDKAEAVKEAFMKAFPYHEVFDSVLYTNRVPITWDADLNPGSLHCTRACADNGVTVYNDLVAYNVPFMGGLSLWHTGDIAFWFNSLDRIEYQIKGDEETAQYVADSLSSALASFAANGDPSTPDLKWDPYTLEHPNSMVFDRQCYQGEAFDKEVLDLIYGN